MHAAHGGKMKTIRELVNYVAKKEGKKSNVSVGDIREIVAIMSDLYLYDRSLGDLLISNGIKRLIINTRRKKMSSDKGGQRKGSKKKKNKGFVPFKKKVKKKK